MVLSMVLLRVMGRVSFRVMSGRSWAGLTPL